MSKEKKKDDAVHLPRLLLNFHEQRKLYDRGNNRTHTPTIVRFFSFQIERVTINKVGNQPAKKQHRFRLRQSLYLDVESMHRLNTKHT